MMTTDRQTTLRASRTLEGHGVHSGTPASITLRPAAANQGIVFLRKGLADGVDRFIRARYDGVTATALCTVLGNAEEAAVATVEHLMSAFAGLGVDNAIVEIGGPEMPIMDGSAAIFVDAIQEVGLQRQNEARRYLRILRNVRIEDGAGFCELSPSDEGFTLDIEIDYDSPLIGRQRRIFELDHERYASEVSRARTFGFMRDVEMLWKMGFALGASLDNTVAVGDDKIVNPDGLRYPDEFVRHKILDSIGDLALAGHPIIGNFRSYRGGHRMNVAILKALFADRANYELVEQVASRKAQAAGSQSTMSVAAFAADRH